MFLKQSCLGVATMFISALVLVTPTLAHADGYTTYALGGLASSDNGHNIEGIYTNGNVLVENVSAGTMTSYTDGVGTTVVDPSMAFDNGSACTVMFEAVSTKGRCNGSFEAVNIKSGYDTSLYAGTAGDFSLLTSTSAGGIGNFYINSVGDVAFDNTYTEQLFQSYAAPTPEPGTWVLLLTGAGAAFIGQRRLIA